MQNHTNMGFPAPTKTPSTPPGGEAGKGEKTSFNINDIPKWERGKRYEPIPFLSLPSYEALLPELLKKARDACLDILASEDPDILKWLFHHTEHPDDYRKILGAICDIANIEYYLVLWKEEPKETKQK